MRPRKEAQIAFAVATFFLLLSGVAASFCIVRLRTTRDLVTHSYDVQNAIGNVRTTISRSGRLRGEYVDTGDPAVLQEYSEAAAQIPQSLAQLRSLTADNPSQQRNCTDLEKITNDRLSLMQQAVALRQTNESTLEKQDRITRRIINTAAEMDGVLQRMESQERILLTQRSVSADRVFWWTVVSILASLVLSFILFVIDYRLLSTELEARVQAQESLRTLSARVLRLQDDERRKFARELHDSLGQYLSGIKMLLPRIGQATPDATLAQCIETVDKALAETRTISHLLHPPLLDEAGLRSATSWYVEGFAQRSGVHVDLDMPEDLGRLGATELVLFRAIQEALTNIHRHANTDRAEIKLSVSESKVVLCVKDSGRGIPPAALERFRQDSLSGVGLAGLRERIRELGGQLHIESNGQGTLVQVTMPVQNKTRPGAA